MARRPRPARYGDEGDGRLGTVMLWPDTFTNFFHPHVGHAAVRVLEQAGWRVILPGDSLCCGLTWISTGQLTTAKRVLSRAVAALAKGARTPGVHPMALTGNGASRQRLTGNGANPRRR